MDIADSTADIAHDDGRGGPTRADLGSITEPGPQRTDTGGAWPRLSPTMRGSLAGNPLRVRL